MLLQTDKIIAKENRFHEIYFAESIFSESIYCFINFRVLVVLMSVLTVRK